MLTPVEGHYLVGFGDGSTPVLDAEPIHVLPGADDEALNVLQAHPETDNRIERVLTLAEGFDSAYGLELLASVHWVAMREDGCPATDLETATRLVRAWTPRKGRMFTPEHVRIAWKTLRTRGWLELDVPA